MQPMEKTIVIDTDRKKGDLFKVSEYNGRFYVYDLDVGIIFTDRKKIGETHSLQDAIELIKASVSGTVREVRIR